MKKIVSAALTSAAIVGVGVAPAHAFLGASNASDPLASSTAYVLAGSHYCTGTVIDPNWIITARHCFDGGNRTGSVQVGTSHSDPIAYDQVIDNPGVEDISMVHVSQALSATPVPLWIGGDAPAGTTATAFGWGGDVDKKFSTIQQATGTTEGQRRNVTPLADMDSIGVNYQGTNQATHGDSGGPVFVDGKLYGVFSMFTPAEPVDGQANSGWYASVGDTHDWIMAQMGAGSSTASMSSQVPSTSSTQSSSTSMTSTGSSTTSESTQTTSSSTSSSTGGNASDSGAISTVSRSSTPSTRPSAPVLSGVMPDSKKVSPVSGAANYAKMGPDVETGGDVEQSMWSKIVSAFR